MQGDADRIEVGLDGAAMLALSTLVATATAGLSLAAVTGYVLWHALRTGTQAPPVHGPVVVLGHRLGRDAAISTVFRLRLDRARALAAGDAGPVVVLGGGAGPGLRTEAEAGADYLAAQGIPRARILLEARSRHTMENLRFLRDLAGAPTGSAGGPPPVLVTSREHVARAMQVAGGMGLAMTPCAAESRYRPSRTLLREVALTHWYLTGWAVTRLSGSRRLARRIG